MPVLHSFKNRGLFLAIFAVFFVLVLTGCGSVNRLPDSRSTPFVRAESPLGPTATPLPAGQTSATVGHFTFAPANARFRPDQPGLSAAEITLDVSVEPSVPIANLRWGPRLEFTEINLVPTRHSPAGEELKIVARVSWGRSDFIDLRPEPAVTRLTYNLVGGTTRSFVTGFSARIPSSVTDNLTFTLLEGTVAEHQDGQARVVASFPLPVSADHPGSRISEVQPNGALTLGPTFTLSCDDDLTTINGVLTNFTDRPVVVELIKLTLYDEHAIPLGEWVVNRFGQQTAGDNLNRQADDPLIVGEDVTFEFRIPVEDDICAAAAGWSLIHAGKLLGAGEPP